MMKRTMILAAAVLGVVTLGARGQELPTAQNLIDRMVVSDKPKNEVKPKNDFSEQASALAKQRGTLADDAYVQKWLELFDAEEKNKGDDEERMTRLIHESDPLMEALPAPSAWPALLDAVEKRPKAKNARRENALKFLARLLNNDSAWMKAHFNELIPKEFARMVGQSQIDRMSEQLLGDTRTPAEVVESFAQALKQVPAGAGNATLEVPDLVTLAGAEKAQELLTESLATPYTLSIDVGDETRKLAQKLALEKVDTLKVPQWSLVKHDTIELFEALEKKFPAPKKETGGRFVSGGSDYQQTYTYEQAVSNYFKGLILAGRSDDAVKLFRKLTGQAEPAPKIEGISDDVQELLDRNSGRLSFGLYELRQLVTGARATDVYATVDKMLRSDPDLPLWDIYQSLAARTGNLDAMLTLARENAARKGLSAKRSLEIQRILANSLLAADRVDEGLETYRKQLAIPDLSADNQYQVASRIYALGKALQRDDLKKEALALTKSIAEKDAEISGYCEVSIEDLLAEMGEPAAALDYIGRRLQKLASKEKSRSHFSSGSDAASLLRSAVKIYRNQNRPADVLRLLEGAQNWGVDDLIELIDSHAELGLWTAEALEKVGRADDAKRIIEAVLDEDSDNDPAYALLVRLDPARASKKFDELFARDQFEERPLIWKAKMALDQKKLDVAESMAREAIAIDPSDGEQGHGDRMRVYAVLADTLEAKGDAKQAEFFRGVVKAIRMSEAADDLHSAGLLKRAVALYEESLKHFADAYCIQSRLAIQLAEMGRMEEAEEHYRKAYELMPDSFGRVESHCFGCESAFAGERQQSIAEKVFTKIAKENPDKPQVHYLLGYLRKEEQKYGEAQKAFQKAVELDPKYLNAWEKLSEISKHMHTPQPERDKQALMALRLDPLSRHTSPSLEEVRALKDLWQAVEETAKFRTDPPTKLFPLTASAEQLEKLRKAAGNDFDGMRFSMRNYRFATRGNGSPAAVVAKTNSVKAIREAMQNSAMGW